MDAVAAREDGLVFVATSERQSVFVVDARDPANPLLVTEIMGFGADPEGLTYDPVDDRLWIGGDERNPDFNGLFYVDMPADPFNPASIWTWTAVSGVESGVTPNIFRGVDGRRYIAIANRWCYPLRIVDIDAVPPTLYGGLTWTPGTRQRMTDMSVTRLSSGETLASVAGQFGGVFVFDLSNFPPAVPTTPIPFMTRFDWTFQAPDFDGNPATNDGCDRNGDGDTLEASEAGDNGLFGRRYNSVVQAMFTEIDGTVFLVTRDTRLAGHVKVWSWADIIGTCPTPLACLSDEDCIQSLCPNRVPPFPPPPIDCIATGWPVIDVVTPVAYYQIAKCPLSATSIQLFGNMLFVGYGEDGLHVIDLRAAGLRTTAGALPPDPLIPLASFDTLPGDSDTVLENYPCHPVGTASGFESPITDWPPSPCDPGPPVGAAFNVVNNGGFRSATYAAWNGCHVYLGDQGTPDADGLPTHAGTAPGLWVLDLGGSPTFGCDQVEIFDGCLGDPALDDGLVDGREVVTMDVPFRNFGPPLSNVVATFTSAAPEVSFYARDAGSPYVTHTPDLPLEATPSSSSIVGELATGSGVARVQWLWDSVTCPYSAIPFTLSLSADGALPESFDLWVTQVDPACSVSSYPNDPQGLSPPITVLERDTGYMPAACAAGPMPIVFEWAPPSGVTPVLPRYNMYRGLLGTLFGQHLYDYVTVPGGVGFADLPCEDLYGPAGLGADGYCEYCDSDESGPAYYYILTGEKACPGAPSLKGLEGSAGVTSTSVERPMGGGSP